MLGSRIQKRWPVPGSQDEKTRLTAKAIITLKQQPFRHLDANAQEVLLAGDFTEWQDARHEQIRVCLTYFLQRLEGIWIQQQCEILKPPAKDHLESFQRPFLVVHHTDPERAGIASPNFDRDKTRCAPEEQHQIGVLIEADSLFEHLSMTPVEIDACRPVPGETLGTISNFYPAVGFCSEEVDYYRSQMS